MELQDSCCLRSSHNLLLPFNGNHQLNQGHSPYKYEKHLPSLEYFAYPNCIEIACPPLDLDPNHEQVSHASHPLRKLPNQDWSKKLEILKAYHSLESLAYHLMQIHKTCLKTHECNKVFSKKSQTIRCLYRK